MKFEKLTQYIAESEEPRKITDFINASTKYELTDKGYIIHGDVNLSQRKLTKIPFKFYKVKGSFWCYYNVLISLEGSPEIVEGSFACDYNKLISLQGSPKIVRKNFTCNNNILTSLEGCPKLVEGHFACKRNRLKELKEFPQVKGEIYIDDPKLLEDYYNQLRAKGLNDLGYNDTENTDIL